MPPTGRTSCAGARTGRPSTIAPGACSGSRHATPVHDDFDETDHVSSVPLQADPYKPVIIGCDGGANTLFPSACVMQNPAEFQWRTLGEFAPQERCSVEELAQNILRVLNTQVKRSAGAVIIGDPAMNQGMAFSGTGGNGGIMTYGQKLQALTGIDVQLAPNNRPGERRGALAKVLKTRGGMLIDPSCTYLIRALAGGFRYKKNDSGQNKGKAEAIPEKNKHSHIAEGCEYGVLGGEGLSGFFGAGADGGFDIPADLMPAPIL